MLSAIVDDLLIRTGNPEDGVTRTGEGATERDPYRSQFNYLWKSLMPGIKQTVVGHGTVVKRHRHRDDRPISGRPRFRIPTAAATGIPCNRSESTAGRRRSAAARK